MHQNLNINMYVEVWKNDYYKDWDVLIEQLKKFSLQDLTDNKFNKYHNSLFKYDTNRLIYRLIYFYYLRSLEKNMLIDEDSKVKKSQPYAKLMFINSFVLWKNTLNKEFWRLVFREETLYDYYFKINS